MKKKQLTVAEAGRRGGKATSKRYGPDFYEEIGRRGGLKGGQTTKQRHGQKFFERIGKLGGAKVRRLIKAGKRAKR